MDGFSGTSGTDWVEDQKMLKGKLIDGKDAGSKFDNYLISPKIR